jgi:hypothetical protein
MSDFPEFDRAYKTVLVKDKEDRFEQLAAEANFNVYHSDIWRGTGRKFAELIVAECINFIEAKRSSGQNTDQWTITKDLCYSEIQQLLKQHFGVEL